VAFPVRHIHNQPLQVNCTCCSMRLTPLPSAHPHRAGILSSQNAGPYISPALLSMVHKSSQTRRRKCKRARPRNIEFRTCHPRSLPHHASRSVSASYIMPCSRTSRYSRCFAGLSSQQFKLHVRSSVWLRPVSSTPLPGPESLRLIQFTVGRFTRYCVQAVLPTEQPACTKRRLPWPVFGCLRVLAGLFPQQS